VRSNHKKNLQSTPDVVAKSTGMAFADLADGAGVMEPVAHILGLAPSLEPVHLLRVVGLRAAHGLEGRFWIAVQGPDPLDSSATRAAGGRYHPRWEYEALYCAQSEELGRAERLARGGPRGARVVPLDVRLERVLDLTDPLLRTSLLVREADLTGEDMALTQCLGRVTRDTGYEGLLVPSPLGGVTLVLFPDRLRPQSYVSVVEESLRPPA
jgi:RES domain-containing protein